MSQFDFVSFTDPDLKKPLLKNLLSIETEHWGWHIDDNQVFVNCYKIQMRKYLEWSSKRRLNAVKAQIGMVTFICDVCGQYYHTHPQYCL